MRLARQANEYTQITYTMEIKSAASQFDFNKNDLKPDQPIYGYRTIINPRIN